MSDHNGYDTYSRSHTPEGSLGGSRPQTTGIDDRGLRATSSASFSRVDSAAGRDRGRLGSSSTSLGGTRRGVKPTLDNLENIVHEHSEQLRRHEEEISGKSKASQEYVDGLEERLRSYIDEVRNELSQKLSVLSNEVGQVQKQLNVQKGECNIMAQQNKDTNRRVMELSDQVQELSVELLGENRPS
eukprot:gb/GECG01010974.1/.p1 GENE.gb/GECG01010974.1/~~gb/GECG01010974.1/.p1  ORF type:complete len:186 (+),score=29.04 gb/GECG01010974.1/:1-558(+)